MRIAASIDAHKRKERSITDIIFEVTEDDVDGGFSVSAPG